MRAFRLTTLVLTGAVALTALVAPSASAASAVDRPAIDRAAIAPYTVSPGKFGPLTMGLSTRGTALRIGYLKRYRETDGEKIEACWADYWGYTTHVGDYADFRQVADYIRRPSDKVSLWISSPRAVTSKGLRTTDSMSKLLRLYPNAVRRVSTTEWGRPYSVYTVRGPNGYLDIFRHWTPDNSVASDNFFAVRSLTTKGPQYMLDILQDGSGCDGRTY